MIMRDVQAANFLKKYFGSAAVSGYESWAGLWDGENILTTGGSQGGFQAIAVAGLVHEVNEVSARVPWFADQGVTSHDSDRYKPTNPRDFPYGEGLRYMDTANLAARISSDAKVTIDAGLIDTLVPPSTVMSIYDLINCNVSLTFHQNKGHSVGGAVIYKQTISKASDTSAKNHTVNYVSEFDQAFKADFESAFEKVCDENVVSVDIYLADKDTTIDFASLASQSSADAIGVVLTGDGLTNINTTLAEIYSLHNDVNSKVWVILNDGTLDGEQAAITLDACMNGGDRPTVDASLTLYGADGAKGQSFVLTANEPHALIPSPLYLAGQGILTSFENITFENGLLSSTGEDGSISFSVPTFTASFDSVGIGDAEKYGNIEGVGLWLYGDGKLTIRGAGSIPDYASYEETPWFGKAVTDIEITEGITSIGANAFAEFSANVNIPKSVSAISTSALKTDSTIFSYDNSYTKTFAEENSFAFVNLGAVGTFGTDVYWHLDLKSGVFTITGTGTTLYAHDNDGNDYKPNASPWTESNWTSAQHYPYRDSIKEIIIEAPITFIQDYCLSIINNCTTIEMPNSFTGSNSKGYNIWFHGMNALSCVYTNGQTPEAGVANFSNLTIIGDYSMVNNTKITKVIFNDAVKSIGTQAFYGCKGLTSLDLPSSLTTLGKQAFYGCTGLTSLVLPKALTSVDTTAFDGCTNVSSLTVLNEVLDISAFAANLTGLNQIIAPSGSPAEAYASTNGIAFEAYEEVIASGECSTDLYWKIVNEDGLQVLKIYGTGTTLSSGIANWGDTSVAPWAAYYSTIQKIVIGESVTNIGNFCFYSMGDALTTIEITKNLKSISKGALSGCRKLSTIYVKGTTPVVGTYDLSYVTDLSDGYQFDSSGQGVCTNVTLGKDLTGVIGDKSFAYLDSITSLTIPEKVTEVKHRSVIQCKNLKTLTFENKDTVIPNNFLLSADEFNKADRITPLETVYGYEGSTAEAWVSIANQYYADNSMDKHITFVSLDDSLVDVEDKPIGEDIYFRIIPNDDGTTYTMEIYGNGSVMTVYKNDGTAFPESARGSYTDFAVSAYKESNYYEYASKVNKIKFNTPNITKFWGYAFQNFGSDVNSVEVELHPNITSIEQPSVFNGVKYIDTLYTSGTTPVKGVCDLSNVTALEGYTFVDQRFTKIIIGEGTTTVPKYCFGTQNKSVTNLEAVVVPASVTSIAADAFRRAENLVYIVCEADSFTCDANAFTSISANATVIADKGTSGESMAASLGIQFIDSSAFTEVVSYYQNGDSIVILGKVDDSNYTAFCTGSAAYFNMGYTDYNSAVEAKNGSNGSNRVWNDYKELITKAVYVSPNFTKIDSSFAVHINLKTVELPTSVAEFTPSCFNQSGLTTLYLTGNDMVEKVVDLSNVTTIGSMALAGCNAKQILLSDNLTGAWGNNMFWKCTNLNYIRIPKGVTGAAGDPFNTATTALTSVLIENPDFVFTESIFDDSTNLSTIIGYKGSTAEAFAEARGLKFVPIDNNGILTFGGFQIKESGYNGLRSMYEASLTNANKLKNDGLELVEFGSMLASTEKLEANSAELIAWINENGETDTHDYAQLVTVYKNGDIIGNYLKKSDASVEFAYTIKKFSASNYNKEATARGYVILQDIEGHKYIVYADLLDSTGSNVDSDGKSYNSMSLETLCENMIASGRDLSTNICWIDILKFRESLVA